MKNYIIAIIVILAFGACSKSTEDIIVNDPSVMRFAADIAQTRATASAFETNDRIGLFATQYDNTTARPLQVSGNWANNVSATFDGTNWATAKKIFWSEGKMDVYGYYPYLSPITSIDEQPFSVALDQSTERNGDQLGGYEASDFLWAKVAGVEQTQETVALQFRHRMSKMVVKFQKGASYVGDFPDNATVYIHSVVPSAVLDFTTGAVTKDMYGEMTTITCRKVDNATYEAIIVPQRLTSRRPFIEVVVNGVSYLIEDTFNFSPGKMYTYNLTINSNPDQVEIDIGGSVEGGWN